MAPALGPLRHRHQQEPGPPRHLPGGDAVGHLRAAARHRLQVGCGGAGLRRYASGHAGGGPAGPGADAHRHRGGGHGGGAALGFGGAGPRAGRLARSGQARAAQGMSMQLAPWTVGVPLFFAALLVALGEKLPRLVADLIALLAGGVTAAACALLFRAARSGPVVYWFGGIRPRSGVSLGIDFAIDRMGAGLATLAAVLVICALLFSARYFEKPQASFQALLLAFLAGICGFALTGDLFDLFVFFELMSTAAFGLCAYKSREVGPLQGAVNFAVTNTAGAFLTLTGIALLYARTGALNLAQMARMLSGPRDALVLVAFALVCTGFLVKAAIVPFHFWLADAHAAAPTPACIIFSGAMVQAGLCAVARLHGALFATPLAGIRPTLLAVGVATCATGALLCYAQRHLKRLLAFSTVSHSGAILCGIALVDPSAYAGAALYVVGHGCVKAALFLCAGMILHRLGSVDEVMLHGRGVRLP